VTFTSTQFCPQGHDKRIVGHHRGRCAECCRAQNRTARAKHGAGISLGHDHLNRVYLPSQPLVMLLAHRGISYRSLGHNTERAVYRAERSGHASLALIDALCCWLGTHPAVVYGQDWFDAA
jgi:hypothetical protein